MKRLQTRGARAALLGLGLAIFVLGLVRARSVPSPSAFRAAPELAPDLVAEPLFEAGFASSGATPSVHSATAVETSDGDLRGFWYGGSREGSQDVAIYSAVFDQGRGVGRRGARHYARSDWPRSRALYQEAREPRRRAGLRRPPMALLRQRLRGGWSGSAINAVWSDDEGATWSEASRLVTSPFLNLSTLVKGPAVHYADGTMGLPVYHEFLGKFGELLRLDTTGEHPRVIDKTRLSWGNTSLQPVVVVSDELRASAWMRRSGTSAPRVLETVTRDGGVTWSPVATTDLRNPDAAIAVIRLNSGELLAAYNDSETDRGNLTLAVSRDDGAAWRPVATIAAPSTPASGELRFAYPWLTGDTRSHIHLLYTWDRERIAHVRFNRAWLVAEQ